MVVRIVAWNCRGGFHHKDDDLFKLDPDISVVSEASKPSIDRLTHCSTVWMGSQTRGLGVIARKGWTVLDTGLRVSGSYFLPVTLSRGPERLKLLAAWVAPHRGHYVPQTLNAVQHLKDFLASDDAIFAGDLNQNVVFDKSRAEDKRFQSVLNHLDQIGMASVWHGHTCSAHGREEAPTFYQHYVREKSHHIDYAFASKALRKRVKDASIGLYRDWVGSRLSDHAPVIVDLK